MLTSHCSPHFLIVVKIIGFLMTIPGAQSQEVTQADIDNLQDQIYSQGAQIDDLNGQVQGLSSSTASLQQTVKDLQSMVDGLAFDLSSANSRIAALESGQTNLDQRLRDTSGKVDELSVNVVALDVVVVELGQVVGGLNRSVSQLNFTTIHLHRVNQIWRSNFRHINQTFKNLRLKVAFKVPRLRTGRTRMVG